jgi:hypothetical protein
MPTEELQIPVAHAGVEWVSGRVDLPAEDAGGRAVLLAHGAGVPMDSPFMAAVAAGIAAGGLPVLRFNYAYAERMRREGARRPPDRRAVLEAVHRSALEALHARYPGRAPILAGKSLGGRMSSYLAAAGDDCAALAFFGYPLHPPGKPDRLRCEHFPAIAQPALFLQGDRDALCDLALLDAALVRFGGRVTREVLAGADHGFGVRKSSGLTQAQVHADLVTRFLDWERRTFP